MEKRVIIATVISLALLFVWQGMFTPPEEPVAPPAPAAGAEPESTATGVERAPDEAAGPEAPTEGGEVEATRPVEAQAVEQVRVSNGLYDVTFTNRGGAVVSWKLLYYTRADGSPLELFPPFVEEDRPLPLFVDVEDDRLERRLNGALYRVEREALGSESGAPSGERLTFRWSDGRGTTVTKVFTFRENDYLVDSRLEILEHGDLVPAALSVGPGFGAQESQRGGSYYYDSQALWYRAGSVSRFKKKDLAEEPVTAPGPIQWAGLEDQYFAALVIPEGGAPKVSWQTVPLTRRLGDADSDEDSEEPREQDPEPVISILLPSSEASLYFGPKKYTLLRELGHELDEAVYFSSYPFLAAISKGIFLGLLWIHDHAVQNYGVAVILSTFLLRLLLFPVNQYSMVSMKKAQIQMQRLQPKVKAIKAKYRKTKDSESRASMNQEVMELYRKEGVNPMGGISGCLPMLAQFPILIGFYNMLTVAVELRGAPFFGWIRDLSRPDPYWITPILMGVTMFAQQKMAMTRVKDPQQLQQQRMMLAMPVVFTVICITLPSGMVLYWFVNNLLGIGQQWLVNRHTSRLEAAAEQKA